MMSATYCTKRSSEARPNMWMRPRVAEQQQARRVCEQGRQFGDRLLGAEAEPPQCRLLRSHRIAQPAVEALVPSWRQAARLHAAEQVEAEVEVPRVLAIEVEEGQRPQPQLVGGRRRSGCRCRKFDPGNAGMQALEGLARCAQDVLAAGLRQGDARAGAVSRRRRRDLRSWTCLGSMLA